MEICAVSVSKAVPSTLFSPFSDQSHLQFYGRRRSSFLTPSNLRFKVPSCRSSASRPVVAPIQAFSSSAWDLATEPTSEEALMKELAELKLQMKQKKKELKAQMKGEKKKMKVQVKEERKRKKQKDDQEGKMKMKCESESSSESCDEKCASVSMKMVRESRSVFAEARGVSEGGLLHESCGASCSAVSISSVHALPTDDKVVDSDEFQTSSSFLGSNATEACSGKASMVVQSDIQSSECLQIAAVMRSFNGFTSENRDTLPCKSNGGLGASLRSLPPLCPANRIEVCTGGKCKKAGSQQLLSALQGQIPRSSNVEAVPCKCMGKCAMAVNVRVLKEDTNPQHHSHVGVEDGALILSHHFGLGCPSVGVPSLSPKDGIRAAPPLVTV